MATKHTRKFRRKNYVDWKPVFLRALAETGVVNEAARQAGIAPYTAQRARDTRNRTGADRVEAETFGRRWEAALAEAADAVELEIRRRAIVGVERERGIYYRGEQVATEVVRVYSDQLLMFLAKALRPERYGVKSDPQASDPMNNPASEEALEEVRRKRWIEMAPVLAEMGLLPGATARPEPEEGASDEH